jgi:hypothetical protein
VSNAPDEVSRREGESLFRAIGPLLVLYLITRVISLGALPIFLDEAVHLQWAERLYGEGRILRPIGSGRLLAVAAYGLALPFDDRLWAARLLAVFAGALTLVFTTLLARRLFGARAGLIAGGLYILSPFALVYDRMALSDGFLCAAMTGLMLVTHALVRRPEAFSARILVAVSLALATLSKVSALLFLPTLPLGALTLALDRRSTIRAAALAGALGLLFASPMLWFFSAHGGEIAAQHVVDPIVRGAAVLSTLEDMRGWVLAYFTPSGLAFAALSIFLLRDGRAFWLSGSVVLPFTLFALFSQPWSARYVLPTLPPLLLLISGGIDNLVSRFPASARGRAALGLLALASLSGLPLDRDLLVDPSRAALPEDDRRQLVTGWPSGYGVRELANRLRREASEGPILVYADTSGPRTISTSLAVLLGRAPSIRLLERDLAAREVRASMISEAATRRVFVILGTRSDALEVKLQFEADSLERLELYQRPGGEWAATLFRVRGRP